MLTVVHSFPLLHNTLCMTTPLTFVLLINIWIISSFIVFRESAAVNILVYTPEPYGKFLPSIYLKVEYDVDYHANVKITT